MPVAPSPLTFCVLGSLDLLGKDHEELRSVLVQPKRLALLTYLVLAKPAGFHRRDSLLALFWPEANAERARSALRQALHYLRKALGEGVIIVRGDDEIAIAPDRLWCDALAFEAALANEQLVEALELYRGALLDGFFPSDVAPEFEHWLERERIRLRDRASSAAWQLSAAAELEANGIEAAHWARKAVHFAPDDEAGVRRLIGLLDYWGDRAGALREYDDFASRLNREFEIEPSPETVALINAIRARQKTNGATEALAPPDVSISEPVAQTIGRGRPVTAIDSSPIVRPRSRLFLASSVALMAVLLVTVALVLRRSLPPPVPLIAVGRISNEAGTNSDETARLLAGLLATDLSRVNGLKVVSQSHLLEALATDSSADTPQALADAARRAGAAELIEGTLYRRGDVLRLDLRRVDLVRGVVRQSYSVTASNAFELTEQATTDIARGFALARPATPLAQSGAGSLVARRFYEQGLRDFYRGDLPGAYKLFTAALDEDSTFAMAAYYSARSIRTSRTDLEYLMLAKAARLAEKGSERDRLVIKVARYADDYKARLLAAESLALRFPHEPAGHLALATARWIAGEWPAAIRHARRVIAMDSISHQRPRAVCTACDAFEILIWTYRSIGIDSFPAVERTARAWIKRQPESALAWRMLGEALAWRGQREAALNAFNRVMQIDPGRTAAVIFWRAVVEDENYAQAERLLRDRLRLNERDGIDWYIHTLRQQGRPSEALALARKGRAFAADDGNPDGVAIWVANEAQLLFELGRFREAAERFRAERDIPNEPAHAAYRVSWQGQHAATAWTAAQDTQRLAQLAATVERVAQRASHGLAWRAPAYLRGLQWQARRQPERAQAQFRAAMFSPTMGYTRVNLELARADLSLGKPREAIKVLREVLGGTSTGTGFYVTRTEVHELMARAFDVVHERDSAAVHYRAVVQAWQHGDPPYRARAEAARRKLYALQR